MAYRTTATVSGLVPIATVFGMLVSNLVTGWLASRTGRYRLFPIAGTALAAVGLFVMSLLPIGVAALGADDRHGDGRASAPAPS